MAKKFERPSDEFINLLRRTASSDANERNAAQYQLAKAIELPLRQGVLSGDILQGLFQVISLEPGTPMEYQLDLLSPGSENDFLGYTSTGLGKIPHRFLESDFVQIGTYDIASSIDFALKLARAANYSVVGRAMEILEAGMTIKMNGDGFHTIMAAGVDRNILVYDADANAGQFTKRLISLGKTVMRRNGGGNTGSIRKYQMTDVLISPEGVEDCRSWSVDQVDEITRREIYMAGDGDSILTRVFGVNLHDLTELGEGQEFQNFFTNQLGGSLQASDVELAIGLDGTKNNFIMPVGQEVEVFADPTTHRSNYESYYCRANLGFAAMDGRDVIILSY